MVIVCIVLIFVITSVQINCFNKIFVVMYLPLFGLQQADDIFLRDYDFDVNKSWKVRYETLDCVTNTKMLL